MRELNLESIPMQFNSRSGQRSSGTQVPKVSQATKLVNQARLNFEFYNHRGECFATNLMGDSRVAMPIRSTMLRQHLAHGYEQAYNEVAKISELNSAIETLAADASVESEEHLVYNRVVEADGEFIFLDLLQGNQIAAMTREGFGIIGNEDCPVRFRRPGGCWLCRSPVPTVPSNS
jgi:hypothetical protein